MATPSDQPPDDSFSLAELDELFFDALEQRGHARLADIAQYPTYDSNVDETLDQAFANSARRLASLAESVDGAGPEVTRLGSTATGPSPVDSNPPDHRASFPARPDLAGPPVRPTRPVSSQLPAAPPQPAPPQRESFEAAGVEKERRDVAPALPPMGERSRQPEALRPVGDLFFGGPSPLVPGSVAHSHVPARAVPVRSSDRRLMGGPVPVAAGLALLLGGFLVAVVVVTRLSFGGPTTVDSSSASVEVSRCGPNSVAGQVFNFEADARDLVVEVILKQDNRELPAVQHVVTVGPGSSVMLALVVPGARVDAANQSAVQCAAHVVASSPTDQSG